METSDQNEDQNDDVTWENTAVIWLVVNVLGPMVLVCAALTALLYLFGAAPPQP